MTKEAKRTYILTVAVCLIPIIAGLILYPNLPERMVTHWDASGNPNGWSSRLVAAIVLPGILLAVDLLFPALLRMDPKYSDMPDKTRCLVQWIIPVVELFASGITLGSALGADIKVSLFAPMFLGVVFIIIGNFMPKMTQSYTVGIKLPWTLNDEENWDKTHRLAGFVWVACGLLMIAGAFLPCRMTILWILLAAMILVPTVYSYLLFLKKKKA